MSKKKDKKKKDKKDKKITSNQSIAEVKESDLPPDPADLSIPEMEDSIKPESEPCMDDSCCTSLPENFQASLSDVTPPTLRIGFRKPKNKRPRLLVEIVRRVGNIDEVLDAIELKLRGRDVEVVEDFCHLIRQHAN